jgi:cytochrome c-type biogenesis protein CcmH
MTLATLALVALTMTTGPATDAASLEREARQIETMLIAPCCWRQQVSQHQSAESDEVKAQVRVLLRSGKSRQQVLDWFVAQYGSRILAEPPARGFGSLLYVALPLTFLLSAGLLVAFVRRASARHRLAVAPAGAAAAPSALPAPGDEGDEARLDDELRDMD